MNLFLAVFIPIAIVDFTLLEEFEQTFHYGMKDICDLNDLNRVVDWDNSFFIKRLINHLALLVKYQESYKKDQMAVIVRVELICTEVLTR